MKFFLLTVALFAASAAAASIKTKRDILPGDSRYGTEYHLQHHHAHQNQDLNNYLPPSTELKNYLPPNQGSLQLPSTSYGVPFKAAPAPAPVQQVVAVQAPAPAPVYQQVQQHVEHHVVQQEQAQSTYVAPVPHKVYGPPAKQQVYYQPAPAPAPAPQVHYQPAPAPVQQVHYQSAPAPAPVQQVHYQPAPAPAPVQQIHYQQAPAPAPQVHYQQQAPAPQVHYQQVHYQQAPTPAPQVHYQAAPAPAPQIQYIPAPAPAKSESSGYQYQQQYSHVVKSAPAYVAPKPVYQPAPAPQIQYVPAPAAPQVHSAPAVQYVQQPAPQVHHAHYEVAPQVHHHAPAQVFQQEKLVFEEPIQSIEVSHHHTAEIVPAAPAHNDVVAVEPVAKSSGTSSSSHVQATDSNNGGYVY